MPVFNIPAPLRVWHLASLDAPTVAVVWAFSFAWVARAHLPPWLPAVLALAVWSIYAADRLLDARRAVASGALSRLRERHFFHWRHRRIFTALAVGGAFLAAAVSLSRMPGAARERGSALVAAALVYLTRVHIHPAPSKMQMKLRLPLATKELFVGLLFAAGCALPAWNRTSQPWVLASPVCFFAVLAWLNCFAIDRWEGGSHSCATTRIAFRGVLLGLAGLVFAIALLAHQPRAAALLVAASASALLLALLDRVQDRLTPLALRAAADLALLTPLVLLLR
jgi:hypothetical protein